MLPERQRTCLSNSRRHSVPWEQCPGRSRNGNWRMKIATASAMANEARFRTWTKGSLLARESTLQAPAAVPGPTHAYSCSYGQQGGRLAAALIRSRRNVPHSISPLFGTLRPSPRRAIRSGAVALGQMRLREQPRRLERLARALAVSLIVVCVAVAVGCGASEEAPSNPPSPRVTQPSEDVTPAPTREAARSSASAVEAQTTALPPETPTPPAASPRLRALRLRRLLLRAPRRPPLR